MKLEDQVVSLSLAQKLKELGVKQESLFWWGEYQPENQFKGDMKVCTDLHTADKVNYSEVCSAFTVAELGEMLPVSYDSKKQTNDYWFCQRMLPNSDVSYERSFSAETEADARAKMLIYLIENNLIKI